MDDLYLHIRTSELDINAFKLRKVNNDWIIPEDIHRYMSKKSIRFKNYLEIFVIEKESKLLFFTFYKKVDHFISNRTELQSNLNSKMESIIRDLKIEQIIK